MRKKTNYIVFKILNASANSVKNLLVLIFLPAKILLAFCQNEYVTSEY